MSDAADFNAVLVDRLTKVPPGDQSSTAALNLVLAHLQRVEELAATPFLLRSRERLLDNYRSELVLKLEALSDTELPEVVDHQEQPGQASTENMLTAEQQHAVKQNLGSKRNRKKKNDQAGNGE